MRFGALALFLTALVAVAFAAWGYNQQQMRRSLEIDLNNRYQRAFYDLITETQNLEVLLGKGLAVGGREQSSAIFASIWQQAMMAQSNLGQLPIPTQLTGRTAKFLSQVADYSNSLVRRAGTGAAVTRDFWEREKDLYNQAVALNRELRKVEAQIAANGPRFWEIPRAVAGTRGAAQLGPPHPQADFRALNREMQVYPTLIYDGPFSDHMERQKPLGLTGPTISPDKARDRALAVVDRSRGTTYSASVAGNVNGKIPAYQVKVAGRRAGTDEAVTCLISKKGGHPVLMIVGRKIGAPTLEMADAQRRAAEYLSRINLGDMRLTHSIRQNGVATCTFVGQEQGAVIYPDMLKVNVALDDGQVIGLDAMDYFMAHHQRETFRPRLTLEQARSFLNPNLKVRSGRLALIPTDGGREQLTYEFRSTIGPNTFLVYIDADNGEEAKILKLERTAAGTLIM
jgi:germination protein YpeB